MVIDELRLKELEAAERKLNALEAGGVDNWHGYDFALESIRAEEAYDDFLQDVAGEIGDEIGECIDEPAGSGCGYGLKDHGYDRIVAVLRKYNLPMKVVA